MTRKHTRRRVYALVNPILLALSGARVTDSADLDGLRMRELSAIESFRTGAATRQDWLAVADFLNICETLARSGVGPEALQPCLAAQEALTAALERKEAGGMLEVTAEELQTLREVYEYGDLQRTSIARSRYEQAILSTANKIRSSHPSVKVCVAA